MVALFHAKSRTCINRFVKASQLGDSSRSDVLCDRSRFVAGRKAADEYLQACDRRHKSDVTEREKKIENILSRVDTRNRPVLAVAEVSLAHAMPAPLLERAALGHIQAAEESVKLRMWGNAEQELLVVENLYAQATHGGHRAAIGASSGVQRVRDMAAEARCQDLLNLAQQHCQRQLFGAAQVATVDLGAMARSMLPKMSFAGRARLQKILNEANDLRLMSELGADQSAMESALAVLRHGDSLAARNQLQLLQLQVASRPLGHPSHEDRAAIQQAIYDCDAIRTLDIDCAALGRAQAAGDLRAVYAITVQAQRKLKGVSKDLHCRTAPGVLQGIRSWDPYKSNIYAFARLLEESQNYDIANRKVVEDTIKALGCLEGPAGPFSVSVADANLAIPAGLDTFDYPSLKARIAAVAPPPQGADSIITLRMGTQHMYFHSANYTSGLADIINTAPHLFSEYAARAKTRSQFETLFDALGFTCVEAQLSALQQAELDPLQEDFVGKRTNREKCDEYLRVFHLKQMRKYAAVHGLNPDGHREEIDAKEAFVKQYFNSKTFEAYLLDRGFRVPPSEMKELMQYEIDVIGVLSE